MAVCSLVVRFPCDATLDLWLCSGSPCSGRTCPFVLKIVVPLFVWCALVKGQAHSGRIWVVAFSALLVQGRRSLCDNRLFVLPHLLGECSQILGVLCVWFVFCRMIKRKEGVGTRRRGKSDGGTRNGKAGTSCKSEQRHSNGKKHKKAGTSTGGDLISAGKRFRAPKAVT